MAFLAQLYPGYLNFSGNCEDYDSCVLCPMHHSFAGCQLLSYNLHKAFDSEPRFRCEHCGCELFSKATMPNTIQCDNCGFMVLTPKKVIKAQGPYDKLFVNAIPNKVHNWDD
jgi:DNA-directed RNA polymerase subunit RPC12/RpoP